MMHADQRGAREAERGVSAEEAPIPRGAAAIDGLRGKPRMSARLTVGTFTADEHVRRALDRTAHGERLQVDERHLLRDVATPSNPPGGEERIDEERPRHHEREPD